MYAGLGAWPEAQCLPVRFIARDAAEITTIYASPTQFNAELMWAALDGVVPFTREGLATLRFWAHIVYTRPTATDPDFATSDQGSKDRAAAWVRQYLAMATPWASLRQTIAASPEYRAQFPTNPFTGAVDLTRGPPTTVDRLLGLWEMMTRIHRLQVTGTAAAVAAPCGGTLPADPGIAGQRFDVPQLIVELKARVNGMWDAVARVYPKVVLAKFPTPPYPEVRIGEQVTVNQGNGQVVLSYTPEVLPDGRTAMRVTSSPLPVPTTAQVTPGPTLSTAPRIVPAPVEVQTIGAAMHGTGVIMDPVTGDVQNDPASDDVVQILEGATGTVATQTVGMHGVLALVGVAGLLMYAGHHRSVTRR